MRIGILAGALALTVLAPPLVTVMPGMGGALPSDRSAKGKGKPRLARHAGVSRITLARALEIALREVPGEALRAEIEAEGRGAVVEVTVFARDGRVMVVDIDGATGNVIKVERDDDEDDEEDEDGEEAGDTARKPGR